MTCFHKEFAVTAVGDVWEWPFVSGVNPSLPRMYLDVLQKSRAIAVTVSTQII